MSLISDDDLLGEEHGDLRDRLSSLADEGAPRLTKAARDRILDRVQEQGPALATARVAQARWPWIGLGAAAAAALVFWLVTPSTPPPSAEPWCAGWESALAEPRDGHLDLAQRGSAEYAGVLSVDAVDGCTTELDLSRGRVDVRADDLGGGILRVVAGEISVEVRGTRFSVSRDGAHVEVVVREGHVVVEAPGEREIHLRGGERWSRGDRRADVAAPETAALPEATTPDVMVAPIAEVAVEEPRVAERRPRRAPQISDRDRLAEAERLWREGERDAARQIFQRVGGGRGALAEAAWVRLARLELRGGEAGNARDATLIQRRRFPRSRLGAEALYIQADASRRLGDQDGVQEALRALRERYPDSPQARAASATAIETP